MLSRTENPVTPISILYYNPNLSYNVRQADDGDCLIDIGHRVCSL